MNACPARLRFCMVLIAAACASLVGCAPDGAAADLATFAGDFARQLLTAWLL